MEVRELVDKLIESKELELNRLRAEVDAMKKLNARLWVAVSHLQAASGEANGWSRTGELPDGDGGYDDFNNHRKEADDTLKGIIGLLEAK